MANVPPDPEPLIEERLAKYRQISREHAEKDRVGGISFAIKPDDPVGMEAFFRMSDEDLEKVLRQNTDQQYSSEEIALMKEQMRATFRNFIEKGTVPDGVL